MIVGSLLLILVAVVLLVAGIMQGTNAMLVASIAASLLAAVALILGGRQRGGAQSGSGSIGHTRTRLDTEAPIRTRRAERREPVGAGVGAAGGAGAGPRDETTVMGVVREDDTDPSDGVYESEYAAATRSSGDGERGIPQQAREGGRRRYDYADDISDDDVDDSDDEDPADEPEAQQTSPGDAARVARLSSPVIVIDGRPRYHKLGCVHLLGRESESLPVSEAVELGFTPCAVCEPDSALLAAARRV